MSVNSITDVGNLALDLLSAGTVQDVENPTSTTEELLNRWYDVCRKKLLRSHPWNFATKRIILAASTPAPQFGYTSQYRLPADCVRILSVADLEGNPIATTSYHVENGFILYEGDAGQLRLSYIYDITDVTQMDAMFVDLLAADLAVSIAFKVTEANSDISRLVELHKMKMAQAKAIDGQERPPQRRQVSKARNARLSGVSTMSHRILF
jgi:hypothetical protein